MSRMVRTGHRYVGLLFVLTLIVVLFTGGPNVQGVPQQLQQILMLLLAISGTYMFVLPYWVKWQKKQNS